MMSGALPVHTYMVLKNGNRQVAKGTLAVENCTSTLRADEAKCSIGDHPITGKVAPASGNTATLAPMPILFLPMRTTSCGVEQGVKKPRDLA
jgi:hypothetical protein